MKYLFLLMCSGLVSAPAGAQGDPDEIVTITEPLKRQPPVDVAVWADQPQIRDSLITVVATGGAVRVDQAGQSISVIGAQEIAAVQGPDITRLLTRLPGVSYARNGGLGSNTGLFVRGANSEQLLVLVDGVRMADIAAPSGGFDLGTLLPGGIGKIELLRGSNSVAWGSDAIGGVLSLTSRTENGVEASAEYGADNMRDAAASAAVAGAGYSLGIDGGYTRTDGISAVAGGAEADPFRQWHIGARGRLGLADGLSLVANGRYADSVVDFDGYPAPSYAVFADTPEYQTTRQASGRGGLEYSGNGVSLAGGVALSGTRRSYYDPTYGSGSNFDTEGRSMRGDLKGGGEISARVRLDLGVDSEWTRFSTSFDAQQKARLSSGHALIGYRGDAIALTGGVRLDDHSRFGSHVTLGANGSLRVGGGWRLRASYGEGFKAPTLYQLHGYGGNLALEPETSRSYDIAVELGDRNAPLHFAATAFRRDSRNLIDYRFPTGYLNITSTRAEGFELEGDARIADRFTVHAAYSYVKAQNQLTGKALPRRPRHSVSLAADWTTPLHDLTLGFDLHMVGDSFDDAGNFTALDGYGLATLRASLPVTETIALFGRVENIGDVTYQTAAGYGTTGRAAYAGVRAKF
jgi:vitamin B12 transporter